MFFTIYTKKLMDVALSEEQEALRRGEEPMWSAVYTEDGTLSATGSNRSTRALVSAAMRLHTLRS